MQAFGNLISEEIPLLGLEPSAILGFRDEYPKLVIQEFKRTAERVGKNAMMVDEFIAREIEVGNISSELFFL